MLKMFSNFLINLAIYLHGTLLGTRMIHNSFISPYVDFLIIVLGTLIVYIVTVA